MLELSLLAHAQRRPVRVLCLGAHCDDIDIGCGGTLLKLLAGGGSWDVTWVAFAASAQRGRELRGSARRFLRGAHSSQVITHDFRDSYFPAQYQEIKDSFQQLKRLADPDLVFTHFHMDRHQDHRIISELTWNAFRRHLIFEYEIPKYEGDLVTPNTYVGLAKGHVERKIRHLLGAYASQKAKSWFTADTFRALMRLRGIESGLDSGWAEGFHVSKLCVS